MPKPRGNGKRARAAKIQNSAAVQIVLSDTKDIVLARVDKNLGHYFQMTCSDGKHTFEKLMGSPRQVLSKIKINSGDIVMVDGIENIPDLVKKGKNIVCEITGILSPDHVRQLKKAGRIPSAFLNSSEKADDAGIEFDYSDEEDNDDKSSVNLEEEEDNGKKKLKKSEHADGPKWASKGRTQQRGLAETSDQLAKEDKEEKEINIDEI